MRGFCFCHDILLAIRLKFSFLFLSKSFSLKTEKRMGAVMLVLVSMQLSVGSLCGMLL